MSDKHLSGEEKRRKMKEQFKKELKERKEFINKVKGLRRMQSINKALEGMKMEDDSEQWIDQLNRDTAFQEAKTEMALEAANASTSDSATATEDFEKELAMSEAEMQKLTAEQMVARMKAEMAAEAEGGVASPNLSPTDDDNEVKVEIVKDAPTGGRLIDVDVNEEGEVTQSNSSVSKSDAADAGPVRRMMDGAIEEAEDSVE